MNKLVVLINELINIIAVILFIPTVLCIYIVLIGSFWRLAGGYIPDEILQYSLIILIAGLGSIAISDEYNSQKYDQKEKTTAFTHAITVAEKSPDKKFSITIDDTTTEFEIGK